MDMSMDMGGMHSGMGSMSMGPGIPSLYYCMQMFWVTVGAVIAAFALVNLYNILLCRHRLQSSSPTPARPQRWLALAAATTAAILRESANSTFLLSVRKTRIPIPTLGQVALLSAYLTTILVLCFYGFDPSNWDNFENIGYRTGSIAMCQLPLIFILAGKRNIIGLLIGSSYERLNWLHRWISRILFLTVVIHMGYWFADWAPFDYIGQKVSTDMITQRGLIAGGILLWITLSSVAPIRGWRYEIFVIQHVLSMIGFLVAVYLHVPANYYKWIWISIALFVADRLLRAAWYAYNNISFRAPTFSKSQRFSHSAYLEPVTSNITKITIPNPSITWSPGQHVFLSCHSIAPLQAHPFTIASIPSSGKMEFYVSARSGITRKLRARATLVRLPTTEAEVAHPFQTSVAVEGPYGHVRPMKQFDSIVMFAGSTGATFTMPLLADLMHCLRNDARAGKQMIVTRRVKFVWVVKSGGDLACFAKQLSDIVEESKFPTVSGHATQIDISVYVTCDDNFTVEHRDCLEGLRNIDSNTSIESDEIEKSSHKCGDTKVMVESVTEKFSCGPNGTCCCTADIDESSASDADRPVCMCNCSAAPQSPLDSATSATSTLSEKKTSRQPMLHPAIKVFSGRPVSKEIMRATVEQARGESAVVVCGPRGLTNAVRASVVQLCDERAVHKGTGAQGIYLHTEAFGY